MKKKVLFTTHNSRLTKKLSALVPQCLSAFTLAETLIVIGIIGVVAALTLPNLNHATGDKETVTRVMKAYSMLNEANDRAVATYGPISTWKSNENCDYNFNACWTKRIAEFLKISKSCDETSMAEDAGIWSSCDSIRSFDYDGVVYQMADGTSFGANGSNSDCNNSWESIRDFCFDEINVDINGPQKGKNQYGNDIFRFMISDSVGMLPTGENSIQACMGDKDYV